MDSFRRLRAWQHARKLRLDVYAVTKDFPTEERYGLTSQLRRAAVSVGANLAEGAARPGRGEFRRFAAMALGSLGELSDLLELARDLHLLDRDAWGRLEQARADTSKLTWRLYQSLNR